MNIEKKLKELDLELPTPSKPGGSYTPVNVRGKIAYVAIQFPIVNSELLYRGRFGEDLNTEDGYKAMQQAALNVISQINDKVGFDNIEGLNHMDAYYQSGENWNEAPRVVDGASDLFLHILGKRGTHSRAIFGVHKLYGNLSVGITCHFTLK
ncbi:hypothetical protein A9Q86_12135 [Flavobacteriales bacterium 33_180_T64]|nr:hypothetical protein A9Q86_12135 [Flavobacteriales bacterium 33_180_T64]